MTGLLEGKVALVTGGARGIGRAIAERFAAEGAAVTVCARGAAGDLPASIAWTAADVSQKADWERMRDGLLEAQGRIDILVNNAGIQIEKNVVESSDADWEALMGANAKGVFLGCRTMIPVMAAGGGGAIVNIGSISGERADPDMALYNASKAFVHGLTRSVAVDHGAEGIRCNAICPGWILTGMADAAFAAANDPKAAAADALARHPAGRMGTPEDIAEAALWLVSDAAAFVTGQLFTIDGGLTAASPIQPRLF